MRNLLAPNGQPSNLTPEQYKLVREPAFKKWFGDWENSPETASKVVDKNGEPLVCRHYSQKPKRYTEFTKQKANDTRNFMSFAKEGFYFSTADRDSMQKVWNRSKKGLLYEVFLNVKNILDLGNYNAYDFTTKNIVNWKDFTFDMLEKYVTKGRQGSFDDYTEYNENVDAFWIDEIDEKAKDKIFKLGYNGVWGDKDKYADSISDEFFGTDQVVVFEPNQIKLADGTNTTFDGNNPDIRYAGGGGIDENEPLVVSNYILNRHPIKGDVFQGGKVNDYKIVKFKKFKKTYGIIYEILLINTKANADGKFNKRIVGYTPQTKKISDFSQSFLTATKGKYYTIWSDSEIDEKFKKGGKVDSFGKVEDLISQGVVELKMFDTKPEHAKEYGLDSVNPLYVQSLCITENKRLKGIGNKVLKYIDDYAINNGHDVVFGHITQKAEFTKDNRETFFCDTDMIKNWLHSKGYAINNDNNDFHKIVNNDIRFAQGGNILDGLIIGNVYSGKKIKDIVSNYDSQEGTDMNEFANDYININDNYILGNVNVEKLIQNDVDLKSFISDEYDPNSNVPYSPIKNPILLGNGIYEQWKHNVVLDGYHRVLQALYNKDEKILAFIKSDSADKIIRFKEGGRTIAQTPASKKDQIYGSDKNKEGSSKDLKSAKSIELNDNTIQSIKNKVDEHNKKYPSKKITLDSAKAVVRRGMGAYSSSHRPSISGGKPNNRVAWGLARLNAFIFKIINGKSKSGKYSQDDDLINELGYKVQKFNDGGIMDYNKIKVMAHHEEFLFGEVDGEVVIPIDDWEKYKKTGKLKPALEKDLQDQMSSIAVSKYAEYGTFYLYEKSQTDKHFDGVVDADLDIEETLPNDGGIMDYNKIKVMAHHEEFLFGEADGEVVIPIDDWEKYKKTGKLKPALEKDLRDQMSSIAVSKYAEYGTFYLYDKSHNNKHFDGGGDLDLEETFPMNSKELYKKYSEALSEALSEYKSDKKALIRNNLRGWIAKSSTQLAELDESEQEKLIVDILNANKSLPKESKMDIYPLYHKYEEGKPRFKMQDKVWSILKKLGLIKPIFIMPIKYSINPKNQELGKIMNNIVGDDDLRPMFQGIKISGNTAVSTDAHKLLHIKGNREGEFEDGIYKPIGEVKKDFDKYNKTLIEKATFEQYYKIYGKIDGAYPNIAQVLPNECPNTFKINIPFIYSIVYNLESNGIMDNETKIFAIKTYDSMLEQDVEIGLNAELFLPLLESLMLAGMKDVSVCFSTKNKGILFVQNDLTWDGYTKDTILLNTTFGLLMPIMLVNVGNYPILKINSEFDIDLTLGNATINLDKSSIYNVPASVSKTKEVEKPIEKAIPKNFDLDENRFLRNKIEAFDLLIGMETDKDEIRFLMDKIEAFEELLILMINDVKSEDIKEKVESEVLIEKKEEDLIEESKDDFTPSYLMTLDEYKAEVTPLIKQYKKFLNKNSEWFVKPSNYIGIAQYSLQEALELKDTPNAVFLHSYGREMSTEEQVRYNYSYHKTNDFNEKYTEPLIPQKLVDENKEFIKKLQKYFTIKELNSRVQDDETKSNKRAIRRAIDNDIYKDLLTNKKVELSRLKEVAESVGIKLPKSIFDKSTQNQMKYEEELGKLLSNIPILSYEKLKQLIEQIKVDLKPLEELVYEQEYARYSEIIKENIGTTKKVDSFKALAPMWDDVYITESEYKSEPTRYVNYTESIHYIKINSLKSDWEKKLSEFVKEEVSELKISIILAIMRNFQNINIPIKSIERLKIDIGKKGFEGSYKFTFENGSSFVMNFQGIGAGGYNIQKYHYRYLTDFSNVKLADGSNGGTNYYEIAKNFSVKK